MERELHAYTANDINTVSTLLLDGIRLQIN